MLHESSKLLIRSCLDPGLTTVYHSCQRHWEASVCATKQLPFLTCLMPVSDHHGSFLNIHWKILTRCYRCLAPPCCISASGSVPQLVLDQQRKPYQLNYTIEWSGMCVLGKGNYGIVWSMSRLEVIKLHKLLHQCICPWRWGLLHMDNVGSCAYDIRLLSTVCQWHI